MKQKTDAMKRIKLYYRIIIGCCICFLIVGVIFTVYMISDNEEKNRSYFKEVTANTGNTLMNLIDSNMEILDGVAITIGQMEIVDLEHLLPVIREINDHNAFFRMGFIHSDGRGDMIDLDGTIHNNVDFSGEDFYQEAMQGSNAISTTIKDSYGKDYLNYYGVPVIIGEDIVGVLAAADKTDRIRKILDTSMFRRDGYSNIINSNGKYIVRSAKSSEITDIRDLGKFEKNELESLIEKVNKCGEHFVEYKEDGKKTWACIVPVEVEDWLILGVVPKSAVNGDYYSVLGTISLITSAMFIFIFLLYGMNRMQIKNEQQLEDLAFKDPLLSIDNYVKFSKDAGECLEERRFKRAAFWYADINNFKIFNETFGYEAGDRLLKDIAVLIEQFSEPGDLFCRENADHFAGIRVYKEVNELKDWYQALSIELENYEFCEHKSFRIVLSVGFYCAESEEEFLTVNEMYNRAKMAQASAKREKNVNYAFYSADTRNKILRENEIEARMKHALERREFKLYIQPKTGILNNNRIHGGEVLVRWEDPERGVVLPGEFIPLFERNGFIIPFDRYMFQNACEWMYNYLKNGGRPIRLAVNVSRLGLFQDDFVQYYAGMKKKYQIPDDILELEFTESLAVEDNALLCRRALELRKEGFICSLDDFGAGYSSLNTLKDVPIQVVKLDMMFFRKSTGTKRERTIVKNVINMSKELELCVVAEGVEEPEQVEFLRECGCDVVQGYVFEKPMPAQAFEALLKEDPTGNWGIGFKKHIS